MGALFFLVAYAWPHAPVADTLEARLAPPPGATRVAVADGSFGDFLRRLPLKPRGAAVHLYDGTLKARQDVHAAVVDLDVPPRDLQQCADAVMRLWAEYRYARGASIAFHPDPGKPRTLAFDARSHDRRAFTRWLIKVFADAGSASLAAELHSRGGGAVEPGDVLIQGGYPGHAVLVLDVAVDGSGRRWLLLGQSYMPAQEFHVLVNPSERSSPWYDAALLEGVEGLKTPEWRPFFARDVRHF
ncbi:MAG TPA: DUF4846 domain-containing protein [Polyangia bacterium]|jgi:hypothetical protein